MVDHRNLLTMQLVTLAASDIIRSAPPVDFAITEAGHREPSVLSATEYCTEMLLCRIHLLTALSLCIQILLPQHLRVVGTNIILPDVPVWEDDDGAT
jgi:hypothetical protein